MRITALSGDWTLTRTDEDTPLHSVVPGVVQTDVIAAGRLEDPILTRDLSESWGLCGYEWLYSRSFIMPSSGKSERVFLVCEGLDAEASVSVNGKVVGRADNAFRTWKFDITAAVNGGSNRLEIAFAPKKKDDPFARYTRSPSTGIWRSIYLQSVSCAAFSDVVLSQEHFEDSVTVGADIRIDSYSPRADLKVRTELYYKGGLVSEVEKDIGAQTTAQIRLDVRSPQLWWPRTMGEQPLYELKMILSSGGFVLDSWNRRIGFRTVSLNRVADQHGANFELIVNGVPLKVYGAGWGTADVFPSRPTRVEYAKFIKSVRVANMNLIRVRGSSTYEHDHFYDLCDEHGILVWQDLMFAGAAYPLDDAEWRRNALAEIRDNALRISSHACIALWCGNDALPLHFVGSGELGKISHSAYDEFFGHAVRDVIGETSPGIPYVDSSVSADGALQASLELSRKGGSNKPLAPARFYSSFGLPSLSDSDGTANDHVNAMVKRHFRPLADQKYFAAISQLNQGLMIKSAVESLRRCHATKNGVVFTSLFDPVRSFSEATLECSGHWKCLHYFARRFFCGILISGIANPKLGTVEIFVHNNAPSKFRGSVKCRIIDTTGNVWREMERQFEMPANTVKRLGILKLTDILQRVGHDKTLVWIRMVDAGGYSPSSDCIRFVAPRALALEEPGILCDVHKWDEQCYAVTLTAQRPAMWCWLELPICQARFDDNFICLAPGQPMRIRVTPVRHIKQDDFRKGLVVHSLYDTYEH